MKKLFHFLGSVHFAITLIAATALFVIAGTFLESWADSHQYAASWTYGHPAFLALLAFFFTNILFAALRRWPFKQKHIPFLITHLGLLMILAGVMAKTIYGVQGVMTLVEGSGSETLLIPNSFAMRCEDKEGHIAYHSIKDLKAPFQLKGYAPNSIERMETWIKGSQAEVRGLPSFPVFPWKVGDPIPVSAKAQFQPPPSKPWDLIALRVEDPAAAAEALYRRGISKGKPFLNYHPAMGFQNPHILVDGLSIPLQGPESLLNPAGITIESVPTLAFLQNLAGMTHLLYFDPHGRVHSEVFNPEKLSTLAVYEDGFGGYAALAEIPIQPQSRAEKQQFILTLLKTELKRADTDNLTPPLSLLYRSIGDQWGDYLIDFLSDWESGKPLHLPDLNWEIVDQEIFKAIKWGAEFLNHIDSSIDVKSTLLKKRWPLPLPDLNGEALLTAVMQQILSIRDQLPNVPPSSDEQLFQAYLRAYGIHLSTLTPPLETIPFPEEKIVIECPVSLYHRAVPSLKKMEDNLPLATVQFKDCPPLTLGYDRTGSGLPWPADNGKMLVRFQPQVMTIPYHIRLRNARQVTYANSQQPFSYEADLVISDANGRIEKTLSMNRVHETWDGYRFYLSSISPQNEAHVKRVQLIVNKDPAKYMLTYPGGILVTLGIILLFWSRKTGTGR
jgi:hypothetical protein